MEACGSAHYWAREMQAIGHDVRLIPAAYVKPFVKRQKNDAADAEAIAEAAARSNMRFVEVKTKEQQAQAMLFRTREMLIRQRTQAANALRAHLAEFGVVVPKGIKNIDRLAQYLEKAKDRLPDSLVLAGQIYLDQIEHLNKEVAELGIAIKALARLGSSAAFYRRETTTGTNVQDGTERHSKIADHWCNVGHQSWAYDGNSGKLMAGALVGA